MLSMSTEKKECPCSDCELDRQFKAQGLVRDFGDVKNKKQISFKTNCGFFLSRYQSFLYSSDGNHKPVLDCNIVKFLDAYYTKGVKVTLTLIDSTEKSDNKIVQESGN